MGKEIHALMPVNDLGEEGSDWLVASVVALHGEALLEQKELRRGVLRLMSSEAIARVSAALLDNPYAKQEDNIIALARKRWCEDAPIVEAVADELEIPEEYLPGRERLLPPWDLLQPVGPPRPLLNFQNSVRHEVSKRLSQGAKAVMIQMPTGAGKTRTATEIVVDQAFPNGAVCNDTSVLWLAHTQELCEQAVDTIRAVWARRGEDELRVVRYWGQRKIGSRLARSTFVVGSLQKMFSGIQRRDAFTNMLGRNVKIVVIDEAHKAVAPSFSTVLDAMGAGTRVPLIGLSATPGRGHDRPAENTALAERFSGGLVRPFGSSDCIDILRKRGVLARVHHRVIETNTAIVLSARELDRVRRGFDISGPVLSSLGKNVARNRILLEIVRKQVEQNRPTILFACTRSHAALLAGALAASGIRARYVDCEMAARQRTSNILAFRRGRVDVLTNFGVLTTGFDAPGTRTVVIARPTCSMVLYGQMIGRAMRGTVMGGAEESWVVDVRDNFGRFGGVDSVYSAFDDLWK